MDIRQRCVCIKHYSLFCVSSIEIRCFGNFYSTLSLLSTDVVTKTFLECPPLLIPTSYQPENSGNYTLFFGASCSSENLQLIVARWSRRVHSTFTRATDFNYTVSFIYAGSQARSLACFHASKNCVQNYVSRWPFLPNIFDDNGWLWESSVNDTVGSASKWKINWCPCPWIHLVCACVCVLAPIRLAASIHSTDVFAYAWRQNNPIA